MFDATPSLLQQYTIVYQTRWNMLVVYRNMPIKLIDGFMFDNCILSFVYYGTVHDQKYSRMSTYEP
jgi:hypothetical protein